ncbi:hypothetical protein HC928_07560 [bacterium]|nr:hypothetical protein [bacterium]
MQGVTELLEVCETAAMAADAWVLGRMSQRLWQAAMGLLRQQKREQVWGWIKGRIGVRRRRGGRSPGFEGGRIVVGYSTR